MIIGTVQQKISLMQTKITTSERSSNDFNSAHNGQRYYFMYSDIRCPASKTLSFLATKIFLAATILQKEVAKRRLLENLSLKHCKRRMHVNTDQDQFLWRSLLYPIFPPFWNQHVLNFQCKCCHYGLPNVKCVMTNHARCNTQLGNVLAARAHAYM